MKKYYVLVYNWYHINTYVEGFETLEEALADVERLSKDPENYLVSLRNDTIKKPMICDNHTI